MPEQRARKYHQDRVAETLRDEISTMIQGELSDPRIGSAHVTEVVLNAGGKSARVYVANDGPPEDEEPMLEALASTLIEPVASPFDVVICEQTLPGIPGLTVLAGLRSRQRATPFILVTDQAAVRERAGRLGAAVVEHLDVQAIRAAVRRAAEVRPAND